MANSTPNAFPTWESNPHPYSVPGLKPDDAYNNNTRVGGGAHIKGPPPAYASLSPQSYTAPPPHPYAHAPESSSSSSSSTTLRPPGPPTSDNPYASQVPSSYPYGINSSPGSASYIGLPHPHSHPEFGPTPLTQDHPLLSVPNAYIGAPGAADRRARWRFAGGMVCALGIVLGVGALVGLEVVGEWGGGSWFEDRR